MAVIEVGGVGSVDSALVGEAAVVGVGAGVVGDEVESDFVGLGEGDLVQVGGEDSVGEDGAGGAEAEAEDPDAESRRGGTERGGGGGGGGLCNLFWCCIARDYTGFGAPAGDFFQAEVGRGRVRVDSVGAAFLRGMRRAMMPRRAAIITARPVIMAMWRALIWSRTCSHRRSFCSAHHRMSSLVANPPPVGVGAGWAWAIRGRGWVGWLVGAVGVVGVGWAWATRGAKVSACGSARAVAVGASRSAQAVRARAGVSFWQIFMFGCCFRGRIISHLRRAGQVGVGSGGFGGAGGGVFAGEEDGDEAQKGDDDGDEAGDDGDVEGADFGADFGPSPFVFGALGADFGADFGPHLLVLLPSPADVVLGGESVAGGGQGGLGLGDAGEGLGRFGRRGGRGGLGLGDAGGGFRPLPGQGRRGGKQKQRRHQDGRGFGFEGFAHGRGWFFFLSKGEL